jgi:hypothetical protein
MRPDKADEVTDCACPIEAANVNQMVRRNGKRDFMVAIYVNGMGGPDSQGHPFDE